MNRDKKKGNILFIPILPLFFESDRGKRKRNKKYNEKRKLRLKEKMSKKL